MSERHFRRLRDRYEAEGAEGLIDRRRGRASGRRAPVDQIEWLLEQYRTRYWDFTTKHFHEHLVCDHGFAYGYTWTKLQLQRAGLVKPAKRRGVHRRRRPRRPLPGMLVFQDASPFRWLAALDRELDLVASMDDATSEVYSAFLVEEESTHSSFRGLQETIEAKGLFCSFYTDRGSHYFVTPKAGGKVDKERPTQVGRALSQLGIEHIPSYSPQARGRVERLFGTLQNRLPQELRLAGISDIEAANRYIREVFLPAFNAQFAVPAAELGACAVEVLMLGDWRATAGEVGSWPEYGHLAGPTLGWKSHTGRPEHKRFVFPTRSMGAARRGASAVADHNVPQHVASVPIRLMFNAKHTRSHSPRTFAKPCIVGIRAPP